MANLIDRDELLREIDRQYGVTDYRKGEEKELVMKLPAVDAEPVRHGMWGIPNHENARACSACGYLTYPFMVGKQIFDYCPYCGARMDGGGDVEP